MIERQLSADFVNKVINDPSIHPWVCGPLDTELDLSGFIDDGRYIALFGEYGGFLFWKIADGIYDAHSAVLPEGRGQWALEAAKRSLDWMFIKESAVEIMMTVPRGNIAVRALVRSLKAKHLGRVEDGWIIGGKPVSADIFSLIKSDWERCLLQHH